MLKSLSDGWFCVEDGKRWRCRSPDYLCEVQDVGNCPSLLKEPGIAGRMQKIRTFYEGRLNLGAIDIFGTGIDILIANAMTESYGTEPSPLDLSDLERRLDGHPELPLDMRLDTLLREIGAAKETRWLVRFEPDYVNPIATPARVSAGAHHMLLSTADALPSQKGGREKHLQALMLLGRSLHAAQLAVEYLNSKRGVHQDQLPLIAATYNAGSPRLSMKNPWRLVQYGEHIDRWISYYNASRFQAGAFRPKEGEVPLASPGSSGEGASPATSGEEFLSPHFTLAELIASEKAKELGISNQPPPSVMESLRGLAGFLEEIRRLLGERPIHITSGYRSPDLNRAVGSKPGSRHTLGLAADFTCPKFGTPLQICRAIAAGSVAFDQVIHEFGRWAHIALPLPGGAMRRQQLTIDGTGTHVGLLPV